MSKTIDKTCYRCKAEFTTEDSWKLTCATCDEKPTIAFNLYAKDKYGCPYTVLSGRTVQHGKAPKSDAWYQNLTGGTIYDTIRRWAADALANGSTEPTLELARHTARLGWSYRRSPYYKKVKLVGIEPRSFEEAGR
jgi:hypothetical protein